MAAADTADGCVEFASLEPDTAGALAAGLVVLWATVDGDGATAVGAVAFSLAATCGVSAATATGRLASCAVRCAEGVADWATRG
jgi:hypothetical protein